MDALVRTFGNVSGGEGRGLRRMGLFLVAGPTLGIFRRCFRRCGSLEFRGCCTGARFGVGSRAGLWADRVAAQGAAR